MGYFFDSYAIIEIIHQNESYKQFKQETIITNVLNLAEVYYFLLKKYNEKTANYWTIHFNFHLLEIAPDIAIKAAKFKHKYIKEGLSYADCIGYITALKNNIIFLTGDEKFKNKENVEFIKK